ncbi:hypothetical protein D3C87_1962580 [compost metagenome]
MINLALAATPWHALAQSAPAASVQYAIAAGPLDTVLNRYAEQAGDTGPHGNDTADHGAALERRLCLG